MGAEWRAVLLAFAFTLQTAVPSVRLRFLAAEGARAFMAGTDPGLLTWFTPVGLVFHGGLVLVKALGQSLPS